MDPKSERTLLLLLAAIQFTTNLDFLIILPLGSQYMRLMHLTPAQFNLIVAAYAIAAGISGVVAGFCLDRFDRKNALLGLFLGFAAGTLLCALAPSYPLLVAARALAGTFGGVTGAVILAIVGDIIPEHRRGRAMGLVMTGAVESRYRGGFMSLNSSVQQFSYGLTARLTGNIIGQGPNGQVSGVMFHRTLRQSTLRSAATGDGNAEYRICATSRSTADS